MNDLRKHRVKLPPQQQAIRDKCFHPSGAFVEFPEEDVEKSIPERFEKMARTYPERVAIKRHEEQITYDELNKAANRLARSIILTGKAQDRKPLVLFLEPSISLIVGYLAILKAGKIALHVDPCAPRERTALLMTESQAPLILINHKNYELAREWTNGGAGLIKVDELDPDCSVENLKIPIAPDDYAHIAYTSGSTGRAKGAVKTHRFALHSAMDDTNTYRICAQDRVAVLGAVAIGKPILNTLLNGAAQYPLERGDDRLPHLVEWLAEHAITILVSSPSAFRHLFSNVTGCPSLRLICLGAEPLYRSDIEIYRKHFHPGCLLVHRYGSNETNTICDYFVDQYTTITGHRIPVGFARNDLEVTLIDNQGNSVPPNQTGEIVVRSRFLSLGYWQRDELTRDSFHTTPTPEDRVYFTRDIGRMSENGCLEHLGRKDTVVKLRGVGIDLGEIEATLLSCDGVNEASVLIRETDSGDSVLVAYIVPSSNKILTVTSLRAFLLKSIPSFMVPTKFVMVKAFPLTATGKVDVRALPVPDKSRPALETRYVPPASVVEEKLERIWAEVLGVDSIGVNDNFFDLGGHSLAATRVVSRVIQSFQLELPVKSLFDSPTVAEMAKVIPLYQEKTAGRSILERMLSEIEAMSEEKAQVAFESLKGEAS